MYCGTENYRFCIVDCLFAAICNIPNGDVSLKYYEKPVTIIETKYQHDERLSDLPF